MVLNVDSGVMVLNVENNNLHLTHCLPPHPISHLVQARRSATRGGADSHDDAATTEFGAADVAAAAVAAAVAMRQGWVVPD